MATGLEEEILRQQPFRDFIIIKKVISLKAEGAISGETFKVISSEKKAYKLRYCTSSFKARTIERNVKLFPKAFARFYGREGRYLLFDWIEGNTISNKVPPEDCYQIGKLVGEAHALEELDTSQKVDFLFEERFKEISKSGIFSKETLAKIELKYKELKKDLKLDIVLEFNDIHHGNLMKDKNGRIYFVDEEGFGHKIKGLGLAKPLITKGWMKYKDQQDAFCRGYNEHHSSDYFDLNYQRFVAFLQNVRTIATRIRTGYDYSQEKEMVLGMIK